MLKTLLNVFRVPELRNKILFTLFMLAIYRIGFSIPLPGVDQEVLRQTIEQQQQNSNDPAKRLASYVSTFSGGNINQSTIFGLGVMPYISASIIVQLLGTVIPALEKLKKEGQTGQRKMQEWTRYLTVILAIIQGGFWLGYLRSKGEIDSTFFAMYPTAWMVLSITILVTSSVFLMWLGEQIDEYGLGNGVSLLIMAGILSQLPGALTTVYSDYLVGGQGGDSTGPGKAVFLLVSFVVVTAFAIYITQAQRRITIQQAKFTRGRKVYGGQKQYLPLRLNHGGVMPVIFAQSLMIVPSLFIGWLHNYFTTGKAGAILQFLYDHLSQPGTYIYVVIELAMIYFFAYFWTTVQFQPKEMATQLRDYGSFVPGIRPGKRTADYLEGVMYRITYVGAAFLCVVAVIPAILAMEFHINYRVASFLGGTGLLIVISVALDLVQRIEANLLMRNYGGFLGGEGGSGRAGIRGSRR
ncbi:MAG: preprotein translocase subunit SecY [Tepidisphaeraceae bacterium]